jgi:hypothetical protein
MADSPHPEPLCPFNPKPQAIIEAANAPTTMDGDRVLRERGIPVLPDIYANGGGERSTHVLQTSINT